MASATRTLKATCLCGSSAHDITLPETAFPLTGQMCHCDSCRHMTGSLCLTVAFLPESYQPEQSLVDRLAGFKFSKRITQYHCPTCGCLMLARCLKDGNDPNSAVTWDAATGTLEKVDGVIEWQSHEFVQDTLDGGFADMLLEVDGKRIPRWPTDPGEGEELPVYWKSPERLSAQASPGDRLHAYCKCRGVEFWIARPSARSAVAKTAWPKLPKSEDIRKEDIPTERDTPWLRDNRKKYLAGLCACNSCRLAIGMEYQPWAFIPTVDLSLDADGKIPFPNNCVFGTGRRFTSSPIEGCHRVFCSNCGATCFFDADGRQHIKDTSIGLLAAIEGARAESWLGWRTNQYGYREDTLRRAESFTIGCERGLKAWEQHRGREDLSGPPASPGAF